MKPMKPIFFATPDAFRAWLEANHATAPELLVGLYKKASGKPSITWSQAVDEALCFGWIDGQGRSLGPTAWAIRFTPRRPTSIWSKINVAKIEALRAAGKMRPAGETAYAKRTDARTGVYSFERDEVAAFSSAHAKQLAANTKAHAWFTSQAPYYQRTATHWVVSAKQEVTRDKRMAELIRCSARGDRIGPLKQYNATATTKTGRSSTKATTKTGRSTASTKASRAVATTRATTRSTKPAKRKAKARARKAGA